MRRGVERHTDANAPRPLAKGIDDAVIDRAFDEYAAAERAALPAERPRRTGRGLQRVLDVGVGADDVRRLAAQFEGATRQRIGTRLQDRFRRPAVPGSNEIGRAT